MGISTQKFTSFEFSLVSYKNDNNAASKLLSILLEQLIDFCYGAGGQKILV